MSAGFGDDAVWLAGVIGKSAGTLRAITDSRAYHTGTRRPRNGMRAQLVAIEAQVTGVKGDELEPCRLLLRAVADFMGTRVTVGAILRGQTQRETDDVYNDLVARCADAIHDIRRATAILNSKVVAIRLNAQT